MRNRGVEIFLLPESISPASSASHPSSASSPPHQQQHEDLQLALGAAGVPGWAMPAAMAAAHAEIAAAAAAAHRRGPSRAELRRWAGLTAGLAQRGWPVQAALATAWQQASCWQLCSTCIPTPRLHFKCNTL